ncbi:MAG: CheR family methyltransferase, partial [Treponema maltophilum]
NKRKNHPDKGRRPSRKRDFLSFVPPASKANVLEDFHEKIRGSGFAILGDNEILADRNNWFEVMKNSIITYTKQ